MMANEEISKEDEYDVINLSKPEGELWSCLARSLQLPNRAGGKPSSFSITLSSPSIASNTLALSSA